MAKNSKTEKTMMDSDLMEIVKMLNRKFEGEDWAEMVEPHLAFFPMGQIWVCEDCDAIHVGFYLNTTPEMIGKVAIVLARYEARLIIESLPVYIDDDDNVFEGEEAFIEFGKMLASAFACSDCTAEIETKQIVEPHNGESMSDKGQASLIQNECELALVDLVKHMTEVMYESRSTVQMTRELIQEVAKLRDALLGIGQIETVEKDWKKSGLH